MTYLYGRELAKELYDLELMFEDFFDEVEGLPNIPDKWEDSSDHIDLIAQLIAANEDLAGLLHNVWEPDYERLCQLRLLAKEVRNLEDYQLIPKSDWEDFAKSFMRDTAPSSEIAEWIDEHLYLIDMEKYAEELADSYEEVDFDGEEYYVV